uniref:NADH dehydrogenase subunit 2 n=1 Tax=Navicula tsukamotoi TaxID=2018706 RepID=UPI0020279D4A|nr:NADH dehydrogenase subunit 2 [Navicula tsukamotoi]QYB23118.1 NADH dehydrogenase subunit 2 [Navicula tsukamotoi]
MSEFIKIQELSFLSEYFLITAIFCLTLFCLFSINFFPSFDRSSIKFRFNGQLIFLLIFILICYLVLVYQQLNISLLSLTSFNDTILNDQLSFVSKFIIGLTCIFYLIFINKFMRNQKLNDFEYCILLLVSIFGFFLICSVNDLITAYLAIELQGLAFYVLASFKKSSNFSVESGIKYFVLGSLSTALFLFGITMVYGSCGSILFTDFKDFFIWIFSANSIFFIYDSFSSVFEFFQDNICFTENSEVEKLKIIYKKLNFLDFSNVKFSFLKTRFDFNLEEWLREIDCQNSIDIKFVDNINVFKLTFLTSSIDDFLIENSYQTNSINFLYALQEYFLDYKIFLKLKPYLLDSYYYEAVDLENLFGFSTHTFLDENLIGDLCFNNGIVDEFFLNSNLSNLNLQENVYSQVPTCFLVSISNINSFFFESFEINNANSAFVSDLSFMVIGFLLILFALFFKLALAPFHLWSPDVYEGSPSSSTFFFMVLSKFGIFVLLLRLCYFSFYSLLHYWQFYSLSIASISIFVGAVAGLKQRKLKSLLTYSSINNMGFVLLAFSVGSFEGAQITFFYLIVYMLASVCIWSIVLSLDLKKVSNTDKQNKDLGDLALLQESNSTLAQGLGITLFSLAGLPPMIGFFAKMGVFKILSGLSIYYLSVLNILFSVIATFYYLRIIKIIFFENILIGHLYATINSKKVFILNLLIFLLIFLFFNPLFLYLYSYKITLFLNEAFF